MENNYIIVLMHIQTSIAFGRPADATILLFWNKKDKSGDNQKALYPTRWPKYCNAPCCARLQSFSVSSPLSVCSFVHGFLLFTVMPNTFMITGGKGFFCCSFYSSFFTAKSWGPYLNSSAHIYLEDFLFMVCHHLFKTWICQKIPAARDTRGGLCFVGGGKVSSILCCEIHLPSKFPGSISIGFHWKTLFQIQQNCMWGVSPCWALFSEQSLFQLAVA